MTALFQGHTDNTESKSLTRHSQPTNTQSNKKKRLRKSAQFTTILPPHPATTSEFTFSSIKVMSFYFSTWLLSTFHSLSLFWNISITHTVSVILFPCGQTCYTLPSYSPRRCGEMWSVVTENASSLHCLHSCACLLLAWRLFIQPLKRPLTVYEGDMLPRSLTLPKNTCILALSDPLEGSLS